jgi:hypothetical protein
MGIFGGLQKREYLANLKTHGEGMERGGYTYDILMLWEYHRKKEGGVRN